jgi:hypothetical protein
VDAFGGVCSRACSVCSMEAVDVSKDSFPESETGEVNFVWSSPCEPLLCNHTGKLTISHMPKTKKKFKVSVVISEFLKLE